MKRNIITLATMLALTLLSSCATKVSVNVQRPAEVSLKSKNIAIMPFSTNGKNVGVQNFLDLAIAIIVPEENTSDERKCASHLEAELTRLLLEGKYLTVIDSNTLKDAIEKKKENPEIKLPVDVYIAGEIGKLSSERLKEKRQETVQGKEVTTTYYRKKVETSIKYSIVDSNTGEILAVFSDYIEGTSSESTSMYGFPNDYKILRSELDWEAKKIAKKLQPYTETVYLTLLKDKSKNPAMKEADKDAKNGNIRPAYEKFKMIYDADGLFEAGYNAAKLLQASGELENAKSLMQELFEKTGNKKAGTALQSIQYEIEQNNKLKEQQQARENIEKTSEEAQESE